MTVTLVLRHVPAPPPFRTVIVLQEAGPGRRCKSVPGYVSGYAGHGHACVSLLFTIYYLGKRNALGTLGVIRPRHTSDPRISEFKVDSQGTRRRRSRNQGMCPCSLGVCCCETRSTGNTHSRACSSA